ncbi:MAG: hypothetical protein ACFFEE_07550 [Candidatus Thorarchaeota archaeon]
MEQRTNSQTILGLLHLARLVIYAGFVIAMWIETITWRPSPSIPGGPAVAQISPFLWTILVTSAAFIRGIITWKIWSFRRQTVEIAAIIDIVEFLLVVRLTSSMISYIIYFNLVSSMLMLCSLAILSLFTLVFSILVWKER